MSKQKPVIGGLVPREEIERRLAKIIAKNKKLKFPSCANCKHTIIVPLKYRRERGKKLVTEMKEYCELDLDFKGWNAAMRIHKCDGFEEGERLFIVGKRKRRMRQTEFIQYLESLK